MPRFTDHTIQQIKERLNLPELIRQTVPSLKKKGGRWWGCCPFHHEKTPSFQVSEDKGFYHCFGCGASGDAFTFVQETRGGDFTDAVEHLAGLTGVQLEEENIDPATQKRRMDGYTALENAARYFKRSLDDTTIDYLKKRGLTGETAKEFMLGTSEESWDGLKSYLLSEGFAPEALIETGLVVEGSGARGAYDRFRGRLMFPIQDMKDRVVGFGGRVLGDGEPKYLNSSDSPFFHKSHILYNLNRARAGIKQADAALLVEGYMDVIGLWQQGIKNAVAACGTAVTAEQVAMLWRFHSAPTVCLDGDRAGREAATKLAQRILPTLTAGKTLQFAYMPKGEDPDSFVQKYGREAFEKQISQTTTLEDVLWAELSSSVSLKTADGRATVEKEIQQLTEPMEDSAVQRHYRSILKDKLWQNVKLQRGQASAKVPRRAPEGVKPPVRPNQNKRKLLALALCDPELALKYEEKFSEISFENQRDRDLQRTLVCFWSEEGVDIGQWPSHLRKTGLEEAAKNLKMDVLKKTASQNATQQSPDIREAEWQGLCDEVLLSQKMSISQAGRRQGAKVRALLEGN